MEDLVLRKAHPDDSGFAFTAKKAAFREYAEKVWGWHEAEQRELHERRFAAQDYRIIHVGEVDVGVMAVAAAPDCVHVHQLFILPEHQGRGIGARCMREAMGEARRAGLPVRLRVLKANPRARAFYERLGFTCTGGTDTHDLLEWRPTERSAE